MRTTLCNILPDRRWPKETQLKRIRAVMDNELTEAQRQTLLSYYLQRFTIGEIARMRGVSKSTVCRTLHRAENRIRRYLQY